MSLSKNITLSPVRGGVDDGMVEASGMLCAAAELISQ